jgi:mycofactocin precursor
MKTKLNLKREITLTNEKDIKNQGQDEKEKTHDDIFETEEVEIEEMSIDGICGVY